jgi:hypothetical protein
MNFAIADIDRGDRKRFAVNAIENWLRFWNSNRRFAFGANDLDKQMRFLPNFTPMKTTPRPTIIILSLVCVGLLSKADAISPPPDDGYPRGNTAVGQAALSHLTWGPQNTAVGLYALASNTTGQMNTAVGAWALLSTTGYGNNNTAVGNAALWRNTTGVGNTANGSAALGNNITGYSNTAIGIGALSSNLTGGDNVAVGDSAGRNVSTADNVICIGSHVVGANVDNSCYIGSIYGQPIDSATATTVEIDSTGKLGTISSSRRFKHDVESMDKASEAILALKPVTFRYKHDAKNTPCFGLVAEDVAGVSPDLVVRDKKGELLSVRYDAVNATLLNEFLKEHRKVRELEANAAKQQKQIEALTAGLQKVSAQLQVSEPARRTALNNQ